MKDNNLKNLLIIIIICFFIMEVPQRTDKTIIGNKIHEKDSDLKHFKAIMYEL